MTHDSFFFFPNVIVLVRHKLNLVTGLYSVSKKIRFYAPLFLSSFVMRYWHQINLAI